MRFPLCLPIALAVLSFASCATVSSSAYKSSLANEATYNAPATTPRQQKTEHVRLELFRQDNEFGEIELDIDGGPTVDLRNADRDRTGFRATFGGSSTRGYFQIFVEEWDLNPSLGGFDFDLIGIGGGVSGTPTVHTFNEDMRLILPFRGGLNIAVGENDAGGVNDADLAYLEFEGELGFGGDFYGAQPSVGVYLNSVAGILSPDVGPDADITGTNAGVFFQLMYKHDNFPIFGTIRAMGGDVEGALLSFGAAF